jgi:hypothetical protein
MSVIILALGGACFLIWKSSGLQDSFEELRHTVTDARMVRDDLNQMLEKSLDISRELVDNIECKMSTVNEKEHVIGEKNTNIELAERSTDIGEKKIRLYELARKLGMDSKDLINRLEAAGYSYNHPLNTIDGITAGVIIKRLAYKVEGKDKRIDLVEDNPASLELLNIENQQISGENPIVPGNLEESEISLEEFKAAHPYLAVKTLADKGYSIREIAKLLNRGQGEVSLILNLLNKKRACI